MSLLQMLRAVDADLAQYRRVLGRSRVVVALFVPGFQALAAYRARRWLGSHRQRPALRPLLTLVSLCLGRLAELLTGVEISEHAQIGRGLVIGHAHGVVIGEGVVLGSDCVVLQGVTIGVSGRGAKRGYPSIGDRAYIGAGAKVLGRITLGDDVAVGANAVVTDSAPDQSVLVGIPARIVSYTGSAGLFGEQLEAAGAAGCAQAHSA